MHVGCMSAAIVFTDVPVQTKIKGRTFPAAALVNAESCGAMQK